MNANRNIGRDYGYPVCCIAEFSTHVIPRSEKEKRKLWGTGYVPCTECNERYTEQQLIDRINGKRVCPYPFGDNVFA